MFLRFFALTKEAFSCIIAYKIDMKCKKKKGDVLQGRR